MFRRSGLLRVSGIAAGILEMIMDRESEEAFTMVTYEGAPRGMCRRVCCTLTHRRWTRT